MDTNGYRQFLTDRNLTIEQVEQHIDITTRFESYLASATPALRLETATAQAAQNFIDILIAEGSSNYDNLIALALYGRFCKNDRLFVAVLELLDGEEAFAGLYRKVGEVMGSEKRDEIFASIPVPPLGTASRVKSRLTQTVMARLEETADPETLAKIFSDSFRDLQDSYFMDGKQKYWEIANFDRYLEYKRQEFIAHLEALMAEGRLFFSQEITSEVIEFVRSDPEISQGVRAGSILYVTKIPYMAKQYLAESDPDKKRYYYCHCPWARESLRKGETPVSSKFCQCSAGFHKKPWEVIFGRPLEADVLESVLQGDMRCRFAIHLPEEAIANQA
jgi:hypothetical protein